MNEIMECAQCGEQTTTRCGKCKLQLLCSRECQKIMWKTHKKDCASIATAREMLASAGVGMDTKHGEKVPMMLLYEQAMAALAKSEQVLMRQGTIPEQLKRNDPSLTPRIKRKYFFEMLQAYDASDEQYSDLSIMDRMLLNRNYNVIYRQACEHLQGRELTRLNNMMADARVGAFYKQQYALGSRHQQQPTP